MLLIPFVDRMVSVDLRTVTFEVPPQDVITRDNVSVKVNAVIFFRVVDAPKAVVEVERIRNATSQIAQTTLRSVLGQADLDALLAEREQLNEELQQIIDEQTEPWGVKVAMVEIKHVDLPQDMQRAMANQAEAERESRAKVINAEGEFQAAERLRDAAKMMSESRSRCSCATCKRCPRSRPRTIRRTIFRCRSTSSSRSCSPSRTATPAASVLASVTACVRPRAGPRCPAPTTGRSCPTPRAPATSRRATTTAARASGARGPAARRGRPARRP